LNGVNKQQLIVTGVAAALVAALFIWGPTVSGKKDTASAARPPQARFDIEKAIAMAKTRIPPSQQSFVANLENGVSRGDVAGQELKLMNQLADFWKDSARLLEPYLFYLSSAAKLENSEKSLNFAAQFALDALRQEQIDSVREWKTAVGIELFEKAIALNPQNDTLKVGLGSCYILGRAMSGTDGQSAMKGVGILREVVNRDSTNMDAQLILGIGGYVSGQYDKAIPRLLKVVKARPDDVQAINWLADCYGASGQNAEAIRWYTESKRVFKNPAYIKEIDERIMQLKQSLR
jgi:tetratricopeptide (TPR) repeat protein